MGEALARAKISGSCPHCYREAKAVFDVTGNRIPQSGDYGLCKSCGEFMVFDLRPRVREPLRKPSLWERKQIAQNPLCQMLRGRWGISH